MSSPPIVGPMTGPSTTTIFVAFSTRPIRSGPAISPITVWPVGTSRAPHSPWTARRAISAPRFGAREQAAEATVNPASAHSQSRPAPIRRLSHAVTGNAAANAMR